MAHCLSCLYTFVRLCLTCMIDLCSPMTAALQCQAGPTCLSYWRLKFGPQWQGTVAEVFGGTTITCRLVASGGTTTIILQALQLAMQLEHVYTCFTYSWSTQQLSYPTTQRSRLWSSHVIPCRFPLKERDPNKRVTSDKDDAQEEWALTSRSFDAEMI